MATATDEFGHYAAASAGETRVEIEMQIDAFATLRTLLADDVTFRGPLGSADDADTCIEGLKRMSTILTDVVIQKIFVDGDDTLTWFDLHTTIAPSAPTANWSHFENGKITSIRVTFDARGLGAPSGE